jgi:GNAT superfamily N-acetyltransferase
MSNVPTERCCYFCGKTGAFWPEICINTRDMTQKAIEGDDRCLEALAKSGWGESGENYVRLNRARFLESKNGDKSRVMVGPNPWVLVKFYDGLNHTPAIGVAVKAWAELNAAGLSDNIVLIHWQQKAFVAFAANKPVGIIVFEHQEYLKTISVAIGWVENEYRKQGIYHAMWKALVAKAQKLKAVKIVGITRPENSAMLLTAKALGRKEIGIYLDFDVPSL